MPSGAFLVHASEQCIGQVEDAIANYYIESTQYDKIRTEYAVICVLE